MPYVEREGDVFVLHLGTEGRTDTENRFHPDWLDDVGELLDQIEATDGPAALVTVSTGKFYSTGLDTDWLFGNIDRQCWFLDRVHALYRRLLTFPMPTVAAINGHAFGAGAMLATAQDFRIMRADRGYWCLPEVRIGMRFTPGMNALVTERLTNQVALEAMTTGRRYGAGEALAAGIVDGTAGPDAVAAAAIARAAGLAEHHRPNLPAIKHALHARAVAVLAVPTTPADLGVTP